MIEEVGTRRRRYWDLFDFSQGRGLEISPLVRATVRRDEADVSYVDLHDRAGLQAAYAEQTAEVPPDLIPEIDYTLIKDGGRTVSLVEATAGGAPFEWVMASHVVEHVPDLIGWLDEIAEITVDGGTLVLAVPDRRYSFDAHRPPTTVGQMVEAHAEGHTRPSARAVYDHFSSAVAMEATALWEGRLPGRDRIIHDQNYVETMLERCRSGEYVDCHVWVFTPESFLEQLAALRATGRSSWYVESLDPTPVDDLEFAVRLRRIPRGADATAPQPDEVLAPGTVPDWLQQVELHRQVPELRRKIARLEARDARRAARLKALRAQVGTLRRSRRAARRAAARHQRTVAQMRASRRWRTGNALVTPLEVARRALRR